MDIKNRALDLLKTETPKAKYERQFHPPNIAIKIDSDQIALQTPSLLNSNEQTDESNISDAEHVRQSRNLNKEQRPPMQPKPIFFPGGITQRSSNEKCKASDFSQFPKRIARFESTLDNSTVKLEMSSPKSISKILPIPTIRIHPPDRSSASNDGISPGSRKKEKPTVPLKPKFNRGSNFNRNWQSSNLPQYSTQKSDSNTELSDTDRKQERESRLTSDTELSCVDNEQKSEDLLTPDTKLSCVDNEQYCNLTPKSSNLGFRLHLPRDGYKYDTASSASKDVYFDDHPKKVQDTPEDTKKWRKEHLERYVMDNVSMTPNHMVNSDLYDAIQVAKQDEIENNTSDPKELPEKGNLDESKEKLLNLKLTRKAEGLQAYYNVIFMILLNIIQFVFASSCFAHLLSLMHNNLLYPVMIAWLPFNIYMIGKIIHNNAHIEATQEPTDFENFANISIYSINEIYRFREEKSILPFLYFIFIGYGIYSTYFVINNLIECEFYSNFFSLFGVIWQTTVDFQIALTNITNSTSCFKEKYLPEFVEAVNRPLNDSANNFLGEFAISNPDIAQKIASILG